MHVERVGSGPSLVMIHGWAMHAGIFASLVPALSRRFTVHLVDLPGHGRSRGETRLDLAAVADALVAQVGEACWLGWSLGGLVCLEAARRHTANVRALALIATSPKFVVADEWPHGVAPNVFADFGRELGENYARTLDRFLGLECIGSDCARDDLRELRRRAFEHGEPEPHVLDDGLRLLAESDFREVLPTLAMPAVWIAGARDRLVPAAALEWAANAMPHARFAKIAGGGHAPFIGHPDAVLAALDSVLDA